MDSLAPSPSRLPAPAPTTPLRRALLVWAVLQGGGLVSLLLGFALLAALEPLIGPRAFLGRWTASFVLVPVTFVPVLVAWHAWALRRFGKRGTLFRFAAEIAFATELIGCVLWLRIA